MKRTIKVPFLLLNGRKIRVRVERAIRERKIKKRRSVFRLWKVYIPKQRERNSSAIGLFIAED